MTRARALKKIIRARAAKTGESYTAARRHVLAARAKAHRLKSPGSPTPRRAPAGSVSDAKIRERTGHGLDHWFAVLDEFGAAKRGHTAAARHLYQEHGVPGWHAQGITVAYERARGLRAINQACDGNFQVSVSKVVPLSVGEVVRRISSREHRARWLRDADPDLRDALAQALGRAGAKPFIVKGNNARLRYKWNGASIELRLTARPRGKTSVVADTTKLPDAASVERLRALWRSVLDGFHRYATNG
jgi:hypothetical protein